jgi:tetratricopeptide (TPR) repeat protein
MLAGDSGDPESVFTQANALYAAGQYDSATVLYQELVDRGLSNFELQYNLGNAQFKRGAMGPAILAYERASQFKPRNEDLQHNLALARLNIHDKIDPLPRSAFNRISKGLFGLMPTDTWALVSLAALWFGLLLFAIYAFGIRLSWRRIGFFGALVAVVFFILTLVLTLARSDMDHKDRGAVILAPSVIVKSEPNESATNLFILHEGLSLQVLESVDMWSRVRMPDGNVGWVRSVSIEEI